MHLTPDLENSLGTPVLVSPLGCDTGESDTLRGQNSLLKLCDSVSLSEMLIMDTYVSADHLSKIVPTAMVPSQKNEISVQLSEITEPSKLSHTVKPPLSTDSDACVLPAHFKDPRTMEPVQKLEVDGPSGQFTTVAPSQDQATNRGTDKRIISKNTSQTDVSLLRKEIHGI